MVKLLIKIISQDLITMHFSVTEASQILHHPGTPQNLNQTKSLDRKVWKTEADGNYISFVSQKQNNNINKTK